MIPSLIRRLVADPNETLDELLVDENSVFWVGPDYTNETIVESCEGLIRTGNLSARWSDGALSILFKERRLQVPLAGTPGSPSRDWHITLVTLNEILAPDFEIRVASPTDGGDIVAFAVLERADWEVLAKEFGAEKVDAVFSTVSAFASTPEIPSKPGGGLDKWDFKLVSITVFAMALIFAWKISEADALSPGKVIAAIAILIVATCLLVRILRRKAT